MYYLELLSELEGPKSATVLQKFKNIKQWINKALSQKISIEDHFRDVTKMIEIGKGGQRPIEDVLLTRYACYLIAQNGDPKKEEIALGESQKLPKKTDK